MKYLHLPERSDKALPSARDQNLFRFLSTSDIANYHWLVFGGDCRIFVMSPSISAFSNNPFISGSSLSGGVWQLLIRCKLGEGAAFPTVTLVD